jgi:hypothetical protein
MMKITFTPLLFTTTAFQTGLPDFSFENSSVTNFGDSTHLFNRTEVTNFFTDNLSEKF